MSRVNHDGVNAGLGRREMLRRTGVGMGWLGLLGLLSDSRTLAGSVPGRPDSASPLLARPPHFSPRAKSIIHIYLNGGPSQVDTFDPKPALKKYSGKPLPGGNLTTERPTG